MFSEETDWLTASAGPAGRCCSSRSAEVVHVGGASHGGRLYVENLRGLLRFLAKHRGRGRPSGRGGCCSGRCGCGRCVLRRERRTATGVRFLASGDARSLLS